MPIILSKRPGGGGGGGAPSGPAGGDLAGTYPNPTIDPTAAVITLAKDGEAGLAGNVTLSEGANVTLTQVGQDIEIAAAASGGGLFDAYAYVCEQQPQGTAGGTFTQDDWRTRVLNTEVFDPDGIVALAANQFTLQAGTYFIEARAPAWNVTQHKCRIWNATDSARVAIGSSSYSNGTGPDRDSVARGRVTIASAKAFELQHFCRTTRATDGFGVPSDIPGTGDETLEVYSEVMIYRES